MSNNNNKYGNAATLVAIIGLLMVLSWLMVDVTFPAFEYASDDLRRPLVPLQEFNSISEYSSRFLWDYRTLDLTGQAFVMVAATIGCLALLKSTEDLY